MAGIEIMERRQLLSSVLDLGPLTPFNTGVKSAPVALVAADVNGDGIPDLVVESANGDISILLGAGNGSFKTTQVIYDHLGHNAAVGPQSLAVADVNGKPAIFASSENSNEVSVITANGAGVFSLYSGAGVPNHSNGSDINALTVANISGTSFLVTANANGSVSASKIKTGTLGFVSFTGAAVNINSIITYGANGATTSPLVSLATGNFISGGKGHDLVVIGHNGAAAVLPGTSNGFTATPTAIPAITAGQSVYSAGTSDLVLLNTNGSITPLQGDQSSTVSMAFVNSATILAPTVGTEFLSISDFNGDGKPDILVANANGTLKLYTSSGPGTYTLSGTYTTGTTHNNSTFAVADLTGDGLTDLIGGYYSGGTNALVNVSRNVTPTVPSFTSANSASTTVGVPFSFTVTTNAFPTPKITFTGPLPPGVTFKDNGNGTAVFSAGDVRPVSQAVFNVTLKATNSTAPGGITQAFAFNMAQDAIFSSPTTVTFHANQSASFTVKTRNGFSNGAITPLTAKLGSSTISHTAIVDGLSFTYDNDGTATLAGTPTTPGVQLLQVTDGLVTQTVTVTILGPPSFGAISNSFTFVVGSNSSTGGITLTIPGAPIAKIQVRGGFTPNLATGLRFTDDGDGSFSITGDPSKGTAGVYVGQLYAVNNQGPASDQPFTFTVTVDQPVVFTSPSSATFTVGKPASFQVRTNGFPTASFTGGSSTVTNDLLAGLTFTGSANGTAAITGTPAAGSGGIYLLSLSDSAGDTQTFNLTIDEPPTFAAGPVAQTLTAGDSFTPITVTANSNFKNIRLSISGKLPAGVKFTDLGNGNGSFSGTPSATSGGTYAFKVVAANSGGSSSLPYTLTVDQSPSFTGGASRKNISVRHGANVNQTISLEGGPTPFAFGSGASPTGLPAGISLTLNSSGTALILSGTAPNAPTSADIVFGLETFDGSFTAGMDIELKIT